MAALMGTAAGNAQIPGKDRLGGGGFLAEALAPVAVAAAFHALIGQGIAVYPPLDAAALLNWQRFSLLSLRLRNQLIVKLEDRLSLAWHSLPDDPEPAWGCGPAAILFHKICLATRATAEMMPRIVDALFGNAVATDGAE
jgi:hypothetical protein